MSEQQIKEYLKKYSITSKELLASHIEELKRNTKPNAKLISELVYVLADEKSVFNSFCAEKNKYKEKFIAGFGFNPPIRGKIITYDSPQKSLNNHVSEVINTPFFLDEVIQASEIPCKNTNSTRHKSSDGETHSEIKIKSEDGKVNYNTTLDYKFLISDIKVPVKYDNSEYYVEKDYFIITESACWNVLDFNIKNPHVRLIEKTPVEIKADWIDFISNNIKRGKIIKYETPAEKTEKEENLVFPKDSEIHKERGVKESNGKINYEELDWDYIDLMSLRMNKNLEKYPPKNWQKKMNIKKLAEASIRHARKILQQIKNDEETLEEHAIALGCNGMMINYQLKNNG